jgi:hypothetical protein
VDVGHPRLFVDEEISVDRGDKEVTHVNFRTIADQPTSLAKFFDFLEVVREQFFGYLLDRCYFCSAGHKNM